MEIDQSPLQGHYHFWKVMTQLFRAYHNREHNDFSIVEKISPSSLPAFWHVKVVESKNKNRIGKVLHVAEDMLEIFKQEDPNPS